MKNVMSYIYLLFVGLICFVVLYKVWDVYTDRRAEFSGERKDRLERRER